MMRFHRHQFALPTRMTNVSQGPNLRRPLEHVQVARAPQASTEGQEKKMSTSGGCRGEDSKRRTAQRAVLSAAGGVGARVVGGSQAFHAGPCGAGAQTHDRAIEIWLKVRGSDAKGPTAPCVPTAPSERLREGVLPGNAPWMRACIFAEK